LVDPAGPDTVVRVDLDVDASRWDCAVGVAGTTRRFQLRAGGGDDLLQQAETAARSALELHDRQAGETSK
jgi:hypothetical protein